MSRCCWGASRVRVQVQVQLWARVEAGFMSSSSSSSSSLLFSRPLARAAAR
jgi:hypothetical protein